MRLGFLRCVQAHHSLVHILFSQDYQIPPSPRASSNVCFLAAGPKFLQTGPSLKEACKDGDGNEVFRIIHVQI